MKAVISTWKTLTDTLSVVTQYRSYSFYPLVSYMLILLVTFTVMIPLLGRALEIGHDDAPTQMFLFLVIYFMYGVLYFIITFFNVALLNNIAGQLDANTPSPGSGISAAFQRIGPITFYTLVSATLGLVSISVKILINPFFGGVIAPFIGNRLWVRWQHLSYNIPLLMAVPVIALDQPAPKNVLRRSGLLVKETWGEQVKPAHSTSVLALLVLLPIILLFAIPTLRQGFIERNQELIRLGLSIMLVAVSTYTQISAVVNVIFALAAYRYATARKSDLFPGDASYAEHAFVKSKKEPDPDAALTGSPPVIADDPSN